jgi:hypothetical protein
MQQLLNSLIFLVKNILKQVLQGLYTCIFFEDIFIMAFYLIFY